MTETARIACPEWTEYRKKNGLDPLGMQNTSVGLYQTLLPGISNVTLRIRYYGLYAWLSWVYANRIRDTNPKTWQRFIRRAEALYALVAQRRGHEFGVAGVLWAQAKLDGTQGAGIDFANDAEPGSPTHYLKQAWGAYGAAYASQLFEVGIFSAAADHQIPVPSPQIGEALAKVFEGELGPSADRYIQAIERGTITLDDLDAFAPMTPSGIRPGSEERQLYQDLLFAEAGLDRDGDTDRRRTLLLILNLARQLARTPDVTEIRWAFYAGYLSDGTALVLPDDDLARHRRRWWVYQANDLTHVCFETLLKFVLDALEAYPGGIPLARLIAAAVAEIMATADVRPPSWAVFLEEMVPAPNARSLESAAAERSLAQELMQTARPGGFCGPKVAWTALRLLAVLHNRVRPSAKDIEDELARFDPAAFRSVLTETRFLGDHLYDDFERTVGRIIEQRVVRRHLWIALRKLRYQGDYTFLIETDDGRVRLRDKDGPVLTNPRLGPAVTFLNDIHLLGDDGLTALGHHQVEAA